MPRIRVAVGVVATVALCIGFNVSQYPVVWRMVAPRGASSGEAAVAAALAAPNAAPAARIAAADFIPLAPKPTPPAEVAKVEVPKAEIAKVEVPKTEIPKEKPSGDRLKEPKREAKKESSAAVTPPIPLAAPAVAAPPIPVEPAAAESSKKEAAQAKNSDDSAPKPKPGKGPQRKDKDKDAEKRHAKPGDKKEPDKPPAPESEKVAQASPEKVVQASPEKVVQAPPEPAATPATHRPLVPVLRPAPGDKPSKPAAILASTGTAESRPAEGRAAADRSFKRFPPLDQVESNPHGPPPAASGAIPFYPTTGR